MLSGNWCNWLGLIPVFLANQKHKSTINVSGRFRIIVFVGRSIACFFLSGSSLKLASYMRRFFPIYVIY